MTVNLKGIAVFVTVISLVVIMFNLHQWIGYRFDRDIQTARVMETVKVLSEDAKISDKEVGKPGNQATAEYISEQFKKMGLQTPEGSSSYLQPVSEGQNNVVGIIPGSEGKGGVSLVFLTHFDTAPGATKEQKLSDASGVATMLETAAVLTSGKEGRIKPKKTLIFVAVNGHYKGNSGAISFADRKYYPIEKMKILLLENLGRGPDTGLKVGVVQDNIEGMMIQDRFIICANDISATADRAVMDKGDGPVLVAKNMSVSEMCSAGADQPLQSIKDLSEKSFKQGIRAIMRFIDQTAL